MLTVAKSELGNLEKYRSSLFKPISLMTFRNESISKIYWSENPWVAS